MYLDKENQFCKALAVPANGALALFGDVIDMWGAAATPIPGRALATDVIPGMQDIASGEEIEAYARVVEAVDSAAHTITTQLQLIAADDAALTSNPVIIWDSGAIVCTTLVLGYEYKISGFGLGVAKGKRYLGLFISTAVQAPSAGKITAGLVKDQQHRGKAY